jgi:hypothetical protein
LCHVGYDITLSNQWTYVHYSDGGYVPKHKDKYIAGGKSVTVLVYLNTFKGGRTYFSDIGEYVNAAAGDVLIFEGDKIYHACEQVDGDKHILITSTLLDQIKR